ncbi:MAG TPA: acyclic terpene utilization AtuA family protein, partial [Limnochorda sp.]
MKRVRVGAGMGFYGDSILPALETVKHGRVQYLAMDHLAELTLAILQKDRQKDPNLGYTRDIGEIMRLLLPEALPRGVRLITNAGGINPRGAAQEVLRVASDLGLGRVRVAVVTGDGIAHRLDELEAAGIRFEDPETGQDLAAVRDRVLFASVYLGAWPIVEALRQGADVVVTGRTTDTAPFAAPLIDELGWRPDDWDRLAAAMVAGHVLECSGQATGGNFSGRWWE